MINGYQPQTVNYGKFSVGNKESVNKIRRALTTEGIFTLREIPGYIDLRKKVLLAASECAVHVDREIYPSGETLMEDNSKRLTLAAKASEGILRAMDTSLADYTHFSCVKFNKVENKFRLLMSQVVEDLAGIFDEVAGTVFDRELLFDTQEQLHYESIEQVIADGTQLEHFHTYIPSVDSLSMPALSLHVDQGLFIVLAPALLLSSNVASSGLGFNHLTAASKRADESGFFIERSNGEIAKVDFEADDLVIMMGDGMHKWLNTDFRPVPHSMVLPKVIHGERVYRSWYGRMVLPKSSVEIPSTGKTFGELQQEMKSSTLSAEQQSLNHVCSENHILNARNLQDCRSGTILCWTQCMEIPECSDNQEAVCVLPSSLDDDTIITCNGADHGSHNCEPACISLNSTSSDASTLLGNSFCSGFSTSMYMTGFQTPGASDDECIVFLFQDFVLDSAERFLVGSAAAFVVGFAIEFLSWLKRQVGKLEAGSSASRRVLDGSKLLLKALIVAFGYFAMLLVMTYSIVLFLMVCLGLTVGFRAFNFKLKVVEYTEHCCASPEDTEEVDTEKNISEK
eukprot:snap_masked-scaffold_29-processed-gene-0.0-mRNA-1 protein AED:1.00 eAED:1.00 QI:0/-1/0/0/-1/1/1/0/567